MKRSRHWAGRSRWGVVVLGFALGCGDAGPGLGPNAAGESVAERGARLHREAIVIDTHSDTTPRFENSEWDFTERHDRSDGHQDLPRMREGGLDVQDLVHVRGAVVLVVVVVMVVSCRRSSEQSCYCNHIKFHFYNNIKINSFQS